jgi:hypothetical protein
MYWDAFAYTCITIITNFCRHPDGVDVPCVYSRPRLHLYPHPHQAAVFCVYVCVFALTLTKENASCVCAHLHSKDGRQKYLTSDPKWQRSAYQIILHVL